VCLVVWFLGGAGIRRSVAGEEGAAASVTAVTAPRCSRWWGRCSGRRPRRAPAVSDHSAPRRAPRRGRYSVPPTGQRAPPHQLLSGRGFCGLYCRDKNPTSDCYFPTCLFDPSSVLITIAAASAAAAADAVVIRSAAAAAELLRQPLGQVSARVKQPSGVCTQCALARQLPH
jgi:hypothetical protein